MLGDIIQFLFAGLTSGAIYALVGLGFALIYNASHVINFAQGEFVMLGGMTTVFLMYAGWAMPVAAIAAILITIVVGLVLQRVAVEYASNASVVTLIIITIGAGIFIRGGSQVVFDRQFHTLPGFSGDATLNILGAVITAQTLWVLGITIVIVGILQYFFSKTLLGKAILATSHNRTAAQLMGINVSFILLLSFGLSAALGAAAGIMITPIATINFEAGIMLGLKGFSAAILGGLGSGFGAIAGGLILGVVEAFAAGYLSSAYKDALSFVIILLVLFFMPSGLFGKRGTDRV